MNVVRSFFNWAWNMTKYSFVGTEEAFVETHWYRCQDNKRQYEDYTSWMYLDKLVRQLRRPSENPRESLKSKRIREDFLAALLDTRGRQEIVAYFDKAVISGEDSRQLWQKIHALWRTSIGREVLLGAGETVIEGARMTAPVVEAGGEERDIIVEGGREELFHARTYVIAAHISFELEGKELEFESFSHQMTELGNFIKTRFGVRRLPGTFSKLKGYSYKRVLKDKNTSKKGQLKPCFRQIIDHPEVFGNDISQRAQQLFSEHFEE